MSEWAGTDAQEIETLREIVERQAEALEAHAKSIRQWAAQTSSNMMFVEGALAAADQAEKFKSQIMEKKAQELGLTVTDIPLSPPLELIRYGVDWVGPHSPICFPKSNGYWTPWHIAQGEIDKLKERIRVLENNQQDL